MMRQLGTYLRRVWSRQSEAIRGNQRQSEAIRGNQRREWSRQSDLISDNSAPSSRHQSAIRRQSGHLLSAIEP
jgi:hypothetical protein